MTDLTFAEDSRALALDLYALLKDIDPIRWRDELADACRTRLAAIDEHLTRLLAALPTGAALREHLVRLHEVLRAYLPTLEDARDLRDQWMSLRAALQPTYEQLADSLRAWDVHMPALRPTNYARSAFHLASAGVVILLAETVVRTPARMLAATLFFAILAWTFEITRRRNPTWNEWLMRAFGPTSHPHERYRVSSATWYVTALVALSLTGSTVVAVTAVAVLGVADPFAALIGRRFGRVKLLHGRTLEGTLAFVAAGSLVAFGLLRLLHPAVARGAALALAGAAALAGSVAELVSRRIDDNFSIPVAAGAAAWVAASLLGLL